MSKKDLIKELKVIAAMSEDDPECAHAAADRALLDYINDKKEGQK